MYVDKTSPDIYLDGQLATATREEGSQEQPPGDWEDLSLPVYNLDIRAEDGSNATDAQKRSGVRSIDVYIDDARTPARSWTQSCPASSCPMSQIYQLQLYDLSAGRHTLRVIATDQVGNQLERRIEFEYIPATGIKDEYVMQYFSLAEDEEDLDAPELAVNLMNGNLVYHETDVDVTGPAVDLEVERYYNTMLPPEEDTEWGEGWTLGQTPELQPEAGQRTPDEAILVESSGAFEGTVRLPTEAGREAFDPELQATMVKEEADGGYELVDESGDTATSIAFDSTGQAEALRTDGYAKVDYAYESGELAEIAVDDPASATDPQPTINIPAPVNTFGSYGSGEGQFNLPQAALVDSEGNILVADTGNHRIQKFSSDGTFLARFGSYGSGSGQFFYPSGIAIDPVGNILVADRVNHRIQKFSSDGTFLARFGSSGSGDGQFSYPNGLAIDSEGNILVVDRSNHRIQKFTPSGTFLARFGSSGSSDGQFSWPSGVAVDSEDNILVADAYNHRIQKFSSGGTFLARFGSNGTGAGQFTLPSGVAVDSDGNIFVTDSSGNHRVQKFSPDGSFLSQFGSYGTGEGQFSSPTGISIDAGRLLVADTSNHRVGEWILYREVIEYASTFGSYGTADGQLSSPQATAVDPDGNILVVDRANNRIQKFSPEGAFLSGFGSYGTAEGQFNYPAAIAVDHDGDILVADRNNHRIQRFNPRGEFLSKFGSKGTAEGQFVLPNGIAIDSQNNVLVADSLNRRIQRFNPRGEFLSRFGSAGTGDGQFSGLLSGGIAVDPEDSVYVADASGDRVQKFDSDGQFLGRIGTAGAGEGQFYNPVGIALGPRGEIFVTDSTNNNVQIFYSNGRYLDRFGQGGSGAGQLSSPTGISIDAGRVWVADTANHRVGEWWRYNLDATVQAAAVQDDLVVEVDTTAGLVSSVQGEEADTHTYEHTGDLLTAHEGPEGESKYEYDGTGRMTRVTLADGTTATIAYHTNSDRVRSVTVDLTGASPARTTYFAYTDSPRQTTVTPPDSPVTVYEIGNDGSIFKWWNTLVPPQIRFLAGSLYAYKETQTPITTGDHNLHVQAYSEQGIASICFVADGDQLVDEAHYEQDPETQGVEHVREDNEWVTATENHPPGILQLEVIVTDTRGQSTSEKFWVNIPYTPPPNPDAPPRPRFADIFRFREDFGLDLDLRGNELEINNRIFNLIGEWLSGDPVARATMDKWGVPLRAEDVAELEYRQSYLAQAAEVIPSFGAAYNSEYAGYYVDHATGGMIYIGFTSDSGRRLAELKPLLSADPSRIASYPELPTRSLAQLRQLRTGISSEWSNNSTLRDFMTGLYIDDRANTIIVGTHRIEPVATILYSKFGSVGLEVVETQPPPQAPRSRYEEAGRMQAGDEIWQDAGGSCTAAFGAWDKGPVIRGISLRRDFVLTAGHCFPLTAVVRRGKTWPGSKVGVVSRNQYNEDIDFTTDAAAIRLENPIFPLRIYTHTFLPQESNNLHRHTKVKLLASRAWRLAKSRQKKFAVGHY